MYISKLHHGLMRFLNVIAKLTDEDLEDVFWPSPEEVVETLRCHGVDARIVDNGITASTGPCAGQRYKLEYYRDSSDIGWRIIIW